MRPIWIEPAPLSPDLPRLHSNRLVHELLARRGISTPSAVSAFLDARPKHAPDSSGFPGLPQVIERLVTAVGRGESIGIFGDYDADGVTATALLMRALRAGSGRSDLVHGRLPRRSEGYGLSGKAIDELAGAGATLLIAVDCGSSDPEHVAYAQSVGLDVVVLDHHQIQCGVPQGAIVASAQLPGGEAFVDLCSAGLAYLVAAGLAQEGIPVGGPNNEPENDLLDLVALGTIADMVPLTGINRPLVRDGITQLRRGSRAGVAALARRAGLSLHSADSDLVSFKLGPRLNAAGRMDDPRLALDLLLEDDLVKAAELANQIESLNDKRKADSAKLIREAEIEIGNHPELLDHAVLVVSGRNWPGGLLGLVSAQLVDRHQRPVIVLTSDGTRSHGSARSVTGFDVTSALRASEDLLIRFGGHAQAAGLTLENGNIPALRERLESALVESGLSVPIPPQIKIDADLEHSDLKIGTADLLTQLQPFGMGNGAPVLRLRNAAVTKWDAIGQDKRHLRLQLAANGSSVKAIGFGLADRSREFLTSRLVDVVGTLKVDDWGGQRRLDLQILDFRPAS